MIRFLMAMMTSIPVVSHAIHHFQAHLFILKSGNFFHFAVWSSASLKLTLSIWVGVPISAIILLYLYGFVARSLSLSLYFPLLLFQFREIAAKRILLLRSLSFRMSNCPCRSLSTKFVSALSRFHSIDGGFSRICECHENQFGNDFSSLVLAFEAKKWLYLRMVENRYLYVDVRCSHEMLPM